MPVTIPRALCVLKSSSHVLILWLGHKQRKLKEAWAHGGSRYLSERNYPSTFSLGGSSASAPTPPIPDPAPQRDQRSAPPPELLKTTPTGYLRPGHQLLPFWVSPRSYIVLFIRSGLIN